MLGVTAAWRRGADAIMPVGLMARTIVRQVHRTMLAGAAAVPYRTGRKQLRRLADEQGALRRIATLVAQGLPPSRIFDAVASEVGTLFMADYVMVKRCEPGDMLTVVGLWARPGAPGLVPPLGGRWVIERGTAEETLVRTVKPVRNIDYPPRSTQIGAWTRAHGIRYFMLCPVIVRGQLWGMMSACSPEPQPERMQTRMLDFIELIGTAIANAHNHAELIASRARMVAAADAARRRVERDLHDGVQQRLISLGMAIRDAEATLSSEQDGLRKQLDSMAQGLTDILEDLREIARGLHPAILSRNGLQAALKSVTRRLAIPVELDVRLDARLDEPIEVAVYHIVSEALANALKHSRATGVHVSVYTEDEDDAVQVSVCDDGVGGADLGGSGLLGLRDRAEALGGWMRIQSPTGEGTLLQASIPSRAPPFHVFPGEPGVTET